MRDGRTNKQTHKRQVSGSDLISDRATNDYNAENYIEKIKEAEKILRETDMCCFCDYKCPPPSRQENDDRESSFGVLQSLWDHIEDSHQLAYEWLS